MANDIVKWSGYEIEDAEAEKAQIDSESGGFWTPSVGKNKVRFLPASPGKKVFRVVHQHYIEIPGEKGAVRFACPRLTDKANKPCPACDLAFALRASGNPADRERAGDFMPSRRVYSNIIDRKNPEQGPRVYAFGKTIHEQLIAIRRDEDAGGDFTHPNSGFDIVIERVGTGKNDTKYMVRAARKIVPLNPADPNDLSWIQMQMDTEKFAEVPTLDEIKQKLQDAKAPEAEAAETAKDVTPPGKGRRASVHDEDDEDND